MKKLLGILMVLGVMVGAAYAADTVVVPPSKEVQTNVGGGTVTSTGEVSASDVKAISDLFTGEAKVLDDERFVERPLQTNC